ncbi:MAG: NADH-quinone oxidoreductase subunit NuoF [Planctomycetes bacterium]|nr:NADH-quinone oxidoreductase subunit NuoF [Planctomycetota bacterium]
MTKVLFEHRGKKGVDTFAGWEAVGGFQALKRALKMKPEEVIEEVKASGLRGRGGAGFPTGVKWGFVPKNTGKPIYLCINADESEPGTCKDRVLMEELPFMCLEGALIAAYAIGAKLAFWYIRGEFDLSERVIRKAVETLREKGVIGKNVFGSGWDVDLVVHRGAGAYICGEETGLISSVEGDKGQPKIKPPFPAVEGAFRCPTIVNNVESLAAVPWILNKGGATYAALGTEKSKGTKLFSVSGAVAKPGVYEVEMGYPMRDLIMNECGGPQAGKTLKAIIPGGSSVPVLPAETALGMNLDYESVQAAGSLLGSGGVIVIDESQSMPELLAILGRFYAHESCGQCTPCREGTGWGSRLLNRIDDGGGKSEDMVTLERIARFMTGTTICFLASSMAMPIQSFFKHFRHEFEALLPATTEARGD